MGVTCVILLGKGGCDIISAHQCRSGEIGRRAGLKIQFSSRRVWVRLPPPALLLPREKLVIFLNILGLTI